MARLGQISVSWKQNVLPRFIKVDRFCAWYWQAIDTSLDAKIIQFVEVPQLQRLWKLVQASSQHEIRYPAKFVSIGGTISICSASRWNTGFKLQVSIWCECQTVTQPVFCNHILFLLLNIVQCATQQEPGWKLMVSKWSGKWHRWFSVCKWNSCSFPQGSLSSCVWGGRVLPNGCLVYKDSCR